ncbi:class I SAM-dependent methyltransferase [Roseibacterium sp. SDUM158016]|uniref:class I SAM-dependent DNA methyltransferase n=1 Tax=Roseicyclus sediminis TaxID=2980997 RepID=UPI0021D3B573|nr:class I SAM-dependent methyltransferase [Roseibacterium sp. SDUM158016]MCU4654227.1 class I SAM-dependent methyltransferase [Roseibacterium sp. SDUM158016]
MTDKPTDALDARLWKPRSVEETRAIYAEWADKYDADVTGAGYETPARLAAALAAASPDRTAPILDFGCGTGLSGQALAAQGFTTIDGVDITAEMVEVARARGLYRDLRVTEPGARPAPGYAAITATGVVSLGAAPPETLGQLLSALGPGGLFALSYNDATLADPRYTDALAEAVATTVEIVSESYGPHLSAKDMGSTVYVLRKR